MYFRQLLTLPILLFGLISLSAEAAAEDLAKARQVIENSSEQIKQTLKQPDYRNDFVKATQFVDGIVTQFVDMPRVSILVLGKNIRKATPEQKQRFMQEFKTLLVRTYTKAFQEYNDWRITFSPYNDDKNDDKTIVKTLVHQPGQQPVNISYRMLLNKRGEWKVYDILIEGVSLVTNYRSSFNQEIAETGSFDSVLKTLADKNSKSLAKGQS
ncbi:MAG: MlaC/ttg2D family ABC transporter substrate-binding protein [Gammaproteobacteria bacterium]